MGWLQASKWIESIVNHSFVANERNGVYPHSGAGSGKIVQGNVQRCWLTTTRGRH